MTVASVVTGSDSYILTATAPDQKIVVANPSGKEFKLTVTIHWEEYRSVGQPAGSLWFGAMLGKQTSALPAIRADSQVAPITTSTLVAVTLGGAVVHYTGQASAHVWVSWYAEMGG